MNAPILRSQTELLSQFNAALRNTAGRWTDPEVYAAINRALTGWQKRVLIPYLYTLPNGFSGTVLEYALPDYMAGPIDVQAIRYQDYPYIYTTLDGLPSWYDVQSYTTDPNATGGQTLRLDSYLFSSQGRVIWWAYNGPVPTASTLPVLSATIAAADTSLTLTTKPRIGRSGYVRIGSEWLQYAGYTEGTTTLTLTNLVRGINGTTAAQHLAAVTVEWGVAMDTEGLLDQLQNSTASYLQELFLFNDSTTSVENYQSNWNVFRKRAEDFWRTYVPGRTPKMKLGTRMY